MIMHSSQILTVKIKLHVGGRMNCSSRAETVSLAKSVKLIADYSITIIHYQMHTYIAITVTLFAYSSLYYSSSGKYFSQGLFCQQPDVHITLVLDPLHVPISVVHIHRSGRPISIFCPGFRSVKTPVDQVYPGFP